MHNFMVDRIVAFEAGKRLRAVKSFTRSEDYLDESFPRCGEVPHGILMEVIVQAASLFLGASRDFQIKAVPILIEEFDFHTPVYPGDQLMFEEEVLSCSEVSAYVRACGNVAEREVLSARFLMGFGRIDGPWSLPLEEASRGYFNALMGVGIPAGFEEDPGE